MKRDSTKVLWRVQVRKSRAHKWVNKGLFETRSDARQESAYMRDCDHYDQRMRFIAAFGFGNTRVLRHVRGTK